MAPFQLRHLPLCLAALLLAWSPSAHGFETVILEAVLNGEAKGAYFVNLTEDGDALMGIGDLEAIGLAPPPGEVTEVDGEAFRSLATMEGVTFEIDERTLSLRITAAAALLPSSSFDFTVKRKLKVLYPREFSAFLNYGFDYLDLGTEEGQSFDLSNQFGLRRGEALFLTDTLFKSNAEQSPFVRLDSTLIVEHRERLLRWTAGDFFARSGDLGGTVHLGGLSYSKRYAIDPYFLEYPTLDYHGSVSAPSEVDIYLDGAKVRTERISPGEFDLSNIVRPGGAGLLELVVRDIYGKEERLRHPFYIAESLLKKGLHEFSYDLGVEREEFGTQNFAYGEAVLSAFHRYGYSEDLTLGASGEAGKGLFNLASEAKWRWGARGLIRGALAGHFGGEGGGFAALANYNYRGPSFSARLGLAQFSENYATLATVDQNDRPRYSYSGAVSYGTGEFGSLSLELASSGTTGNDLQSLTLSYSRGLPRNLSMVTSARFATDDAGSSTTMIFSLNYHPWADIQTSGRLEFRDEGSAQGLQVVKSPPVGQGYGYQAGLERSDLSGSGATTLDGLLQYNGPYGIYRGELGLESGEGTNALRYRMTASGAVTYLGEKVGFSRPIHDSFGLVQVGDLEGVRVYHNSQEVGRTDASGRLLIPNLSSYYENQISIEDKDIPLDYSLASVVRYVSPPLRGGACMGFRTVKFQPLTGRLQIRRGSDLIPLEFQEVRFRLDGTVATVPTGKGGEFYLDPAEETKKGAGADAPEPGCADLALQQENGGTLVELAGEIEVEGRTYAFTIDIPESEDFFIDLGPVVVNHPKEGALQ